MAGRTSRPSFRIVFWAGAAAVLAVLLAVAFRPQPVLVDLGHVSQGPMTDSVRDEGRTRVRETYVVSAPLAGRILRVGNRTGDRVAAGEVVAVMLPSDPGFLDERSRLEAEANLRSAEEALSLARAEVERSEAALAHARAELDRAEALSRRGAVTQSELDRRRLNLRTATAELRSARASVGVREAELEAARVRLMEPTSHDPAQPEASRTGPVELKTPVSGSILRVMQQSEGVVAPGAPILEIGDTGDLEIVAELLSGDAVRVREGAEVRIDAWGGEFPLRGRVRLVEPAGFRKVSALGVEEQRVNVLIDFLDPREEWAAIGDGYRVEAAITVWTSDDVVQAPVGAVFRDGDAWAVFRVDDGRARLTRIDAGRNDGRSVQILSGLEPGQRVILYPGPAVSDGVRVRAREDG